MKWFRNLVGSADKTASSRPSVEALEDRWLPNVSVAFSSSGQLSRAIVFTDNVNAANNTAFLFNPDGTATFLGKNVNKVHLYRDANGQIGVDIVYNNLNNSATAAAGSNGQAYEFDSTGFRSFGAGINDVSRAVDAKGNFRLDVVYDDGSGAGTGNLFEYTNNNLNTGLIAKNVYFATAYLDNKGGPLGFAYGLLDAPKGSAHAFAFDSLGARLLDIEPAGVGPLTTDFQFGSNPSSSTFVIDQTFGNNFGTTVTVGYGTAQETTSTGLMSVLGNLVPGGGSFNINP